MATLKVLLIEKEVPLSTLRELIIPKIQEDELRELLWICAKRQWVTVEEHPFHLVRIDLANVSQIAYADLLAHLITRRFSPPATAILFYLLNYRVSSKEQLLAELTNYLALSGEGGCTAELSSQIDMLKSEGLAVETGNDTLLRLNDRALFSLLRQEIVVRWLRQRCTSQMLLVAEGVLSASPVAKRSSQVGKTQWVRLATACLPALAAAPNLFRTTGIVEAARELANSFPQVFELDAEATSMRADWTWLAHQLQMEVLEAYISGTFSQEHLRVFRAILHMSLRSQKQIADQTLLGLKRVSPILYDLEAGSALVRLKPSSAPDDFRPNVGVLAQVVEEKLWAVAGKLSDRMQKVILPAEKAKRQMLKLKDSLRGISERLFVLREF